MTDLERIGNLMVKTQGEIEAALSEGITRFQQEYMGRGPKHISSHLIGDLLVIRLQGVLTSPSNTWLRRFQRRRAEIC